jgi:hypothetical protein
VRGRIVKSLPGCLVLGADNGKGYELFEKNADAWTEVMRIFATKGCAEISGCAYVDLPTTCQMGTPLYVISCKQIDCPGSNCPIRSGKVGQDVTLTGTITVSGEGCFVLTDASGVNYELEKDDLYPDAWDEVLAIKQGGCAEIDGCAYKGMSPNCAGSSMPVYVKSCKEVAVCLKPNPKSPEGKGVMSAPPTLTSVSKESVKSIVTAKIQSSVEVKEKNARPIAASLAKNLSGLEIH